MTLSKCSKRLDLYDQHSFKMKIIKYALDNFPDNYENRKMIQSI